MKQKCDYQSKVAKFKEQSLYGLLTAADRRFLDVVIQKHCFTWQELNILAESARDLEQWQEGPFEAIWRKAEECVPDGLESNAHKNKVLTCFDELMSNLKEAAKSYPPEGLATPPLRKQKATVKSNGRLVLGRCPVCSDKTICCNLQTLDAVEGCPYACSYCSIQTFYGADYAFHADLPELLDQLSVPADKYSHIGIGQSSDALAWGNQHGVLDALIEFAKHNPKVLLELKSKSENVDYLVSVPLPRNLLCSWTLNTPTVVRNEEHLSAGVGDRLKAAQRIIAHGAKVAFHFHPIVYYSAWEEEYAALAARIVSEFKPDDVAFISFGTVTLIKPVAKQIRRQGNPTKILQMELVPDPHGRLTYPDGKKVKLYEKLSKSFEAWKDEVFFYLCMEKADIWRTVFGRCYSSNEEFETALLNAVFNKIGTVAEYPSDNSRY